jgi:cyanophycin synthetase
MPPLRLQELHGPGLIWDGPAWLIHWPLNIPGDAAAARQWHNQALTAVARHFPRLTKTQAPGCGQELETSAAALLVSIARQILAPAQVDLQRPQLGLKTPEHLWIATCIQHELAGTALSLACQLITTSWLQPENSSNQSDLDIHLARLQLNSTICCQHPVTMKLLSEARRRGIPHLLIDPSIRLYQLGSGCQARWINSTATDRDSQIGCGIAQDKQKTNKLLRSLGLPVPRQISLLATCNDDDLVKAAARIGYPCVLKPADRDQGRGVTVGIKNEAHLMRAAKEARREATHKLVIEAMIQGNDIRLTMLNGTLAWAVERQPPSITGDGISTVSELIAAANKYRAELRALDGLSGLIPADAETLHHLEQAKLKLGDVPPTGQTIQLRSNANVSTGGLFREVTEQVHPKIRRQCETIAATLRLAAVGIDYLCHDISQPPSQAPGAFIEVNWMPQVSSERTNVVFRELFPSDTPHSMPTTVMIARFETEERVALQQKLTEMIAADPHLTIAFPQRLADSVATLNLAATSRHRPYRHPKEVLMDASERSMLFLLDPQQVLQHGLPVSAPDHAIFWTEKPFKHSATWNQFMHRIQSPVPPQVVQGADS